MIDVVVFHHALGVTPGLAELADELRSAGHRVDLPDLFDGATFTSLEEGVAHAEAIGFDEVIERGVAAVAERSEPFAVIGFSLGVLPAQKLAQTNPAVRGAVLCHAAVPVEVFGDVWPSSVPLQLHFVADDPWAEEDLPVAREIAERTGADLAVHPGARHLVADSSSPDHDPAVRSEMVAAMLRFLAGLSTADPPAEPLG